MSASRPIKAEVSTAVRGENPWIVLGVLCVAVVFSLTTWFSATAVTPELKVAWSLSDTAVGWLTNGVQIGFVTGALLASFVNLPDIVRLNRLMAASAAIAALANAMLLLEPGPAGAVACRIATGVALAGVYPPALKLVSTWFVRNRGLALGAVIAALTLGSSLPHLFRSLAQSLDWTLVISLSSVAALIGALCFLLFAKEGPHPFGRAIFNPAQIGIVFRDRNLFLVNVGYLGHMWELYAMWAWLLVYLRSSIELFSGPSAALASLVTFAAIASGVVGCIAGGLLSDRYGRTATTAGFMMISGACAIAMCFVYGGPIWLIATVAIVWGITIIGDSAQFSAAVTELGQREFVGTALSLQLGLGFALTIFVIWLMPHLADLLGGWRWTFLFLAPGPIIGTIAMLKLRKSPASLRLANGKR
ncbi:MFS transporter [Mesorhizobium sp. SB112]|uniref:MFS transporter n=1 Tax=Mesorhizobium sp. SB112 TaxID=3151853 RepID=UPI0032633596